MKKILIILTTLWLMVETNAQGQWALTGNAINAGEFLGTTNSQPLELKTTATGANAQNINFYTRGTQKVTILGNNGSTDGYVGIGWNAPNYHLQLYNSATTSDVYQQFTTGSTSNTSGDGFLVGVHGHMVGMNTVNDAELLQLENGPMNFYTFGVQRMVIKCGQPGDPNTGNIGIGDGFDAPESLLHIRENITDEDAWFQLTTKNTGHTSGDGLRIGVIDNSNSKNVEIKQQENADMLFFTNSLERVRIFSNGLVGVNTSTSTPGYVKLGDYEHTAGGINFGIYSTVTENSKDNYGIKAVANGDQANWGGHFIAGGSAPANYGGYFQAGGLAGCTGISVPVTGNQNIAGKFVSTDNTNTGTNVGGAFEACGSSSAVNIGLYAATDGSGTKNYAGYFWGDIWGNGISGTTGNVILSDQIFKTNITPIPDAMSLIFQLQPKSFFLDTNNIYGMRFTSKKQYGLIAQEVETVLPELIHELTKLAQTDSSGNIITPELTYKALNYNALFGIMLKGMQEQEARIDLLEQALASCCPSNLRTGSEEFPVSQSIDLISSDPILYQNIPNPFNIETKIKFFIPDNAISKTLMIFDMQGTLLKQISIAENGESFITIHANEFRAGMYMYSLIIDGKEIDSKRMILTN